MHKIDEVLSCNKDKKNVKASVDTALQNLLALDGQADVSQLNIQDPLNSLPVAYNEWGVDSSEYDIIGSNNITMGGHLHLLSDDDILKKNSSKTQRKWGEVSKVKEDSNHTISDSTSTERLENNIKKFIPFQLRPKINVESHEAFPSLFNAVMKTPVNNTSYDSQKIKDKTIKKTIPIISERKHSGTEIVVDSSEMKTFIMDSMKRLFADIKLPNTNVLYSESLSKEKYIQRLKQDNIINC